MEPNKLQKKDGDQSCIIYHDPNSCISHNFDEFGVGKHNYTVNLTGETIIVVIKRQIEEFKPKCKYPFSFVAGFVDGCFVLIFFDGKSLLKYKLKILHNKNNDSYVIDVQNYGDRSEFNNCLIDLFQNIRKALQGAEYVEPKNQLRLSNKTLRPINTSGCKPIDISVQKENASNDLQRCLENIESEFSEIRLNAFATILKIVQMDFLVLESKDIVENLSNIIKQSVVDDFDEIVFFALFSMWKLNNLPQYHSRFSDPTNLSSLLCILLTAPADSTREIETVQMRLYASCILLSMKDEYIDNLHQSLQIYNNRKGSFSDCIHRSIHPTLREKLCQVAELFA